jgi:phenylacetate-coenzyme A ligase PaaK-like adenylate-forming protein
MPLSDRIFTANEQNFNELSLEIFQFQYSSCEIYRKYVNNLNISPESISHFTEIPFLPISFFRTHKVIQSENYEEVFESSGTTSNQTSRHYIKESHLYKESLTRAFELFVGPVKDYCILALLPGYLERKNSSLVFMVNHLMEKSSSPDSDFYLYDRDKLCRKLEELEEKNEKYILFGVSFALMDLSSEIENRGLNLSNAIVFETGGMKGKRKEIVRDELHSILKKALGASEIFSEYGMTELLSQAYYTNQNSFRTPPWMKVLGREINDPLSNKKSGRNLALNVIDLANVNSCSFIATDDLGTIHSNGSFEVLGRMDHSIARGCNLLLEPDK